MNTAPERHPESGAGFIDISDIIGFLWRSRWYLLGGALGGVAGGLVRLATLPKDGIALGWVPVNIFVDGETDPKTMVGKTNDLMGSNEFAAPFFKHLTAKAGPEMGQLLKTPAFQWVDFQNLQTLSSSIDSRVFFLTYDESIKESKLWLRVPGWDPDLVHLEGTVFIEAAKGAVDTIAKDSLVVKTSNVSFDKSDYESTLAHYSTATTKRQTEKAWEFVQLFGLLQDIEAKVPIRSFDELIGLSTEHRIQWLIAKGLGKKQLNLAIAKQYSAELGKLQSRMMISDQMGSESIHKIATKLSSLRRPDANVDSAGSPRHGDQVIPKADEVAKSKFHILPKMNSRGIAWLKNDLGVRKLFIFGIAGSGIGGLVFGLLQYFLHNKERLRRAILAN